MKFLILYISLASIASSFNLYAQSLTLGSGLSIEHYRPVGKKSPYYSKMQNHFWVLTGGSFSFDFGVKNRFFHSASAYANAYPLTFGSSIYLGEQNRFIITNIDLIAPEIGFLGYYNFLEKPKLIMKAGLGLATRFVIDPVTGGSTSFGSQMVTYYSEHRQISWFTLSAPLELRLTYKLNDFLGITLGLKRTFGFFRWVEESISYELFNVENNTSETGTATMATNGNRSLYEFGLVFYLNRIK